MDERDCKGARRKAGRPGKLLMSDRRFHWSADCPCSNPGHARSDPAAASHSAWRQDLAGFRM